MVKYEIWSKKLEPLFDFRDFLVASHKNFKLKFFFSFNIKAMLSEILLGISSPIKIKTQKISELFFE